MVRKSSSIVATCIQLVLITISFATSAKSQDTVTRNQLLAPAKARDAIQMARIALSQQDLEVATDQLNRALQEYPDYAVALTTRGLLNIQTGNTDQGISDLERAIKVDPGYGVPFLVLASVRNDREEYDAALDLLERGMRLLPKAWQGPAARARALLGKGDAPTALQEIVRAESLASGTMDQFNVAYVHFVKASALLALHGCAEARSELQLAIANDPSGRVGMASTRMLERCLLPAHK